MKYIIRIVFVSVVLITQLSCTKRREIEGSYEAQKEIAKSIVPTLETTPLKESIFADAADDPAIWINPVDITKSLIIGTDKINGLAVYNLQGDLIDFYAVGAMNNVDIRYNFVNGADTFDILAASNRTYNTISIFKINKTNGSLEEISNHPLQSNVDEVYGFCLYKSPLSDKFYAFVNSKYGEVEQWLLSPSVNGTINGEIVRKFNVRTQVEGMVADDKYQRLFVGEEIKGIWIFNAEPNFADTIGWFNANSGVDNPFIKFDIEGLGIYQSTDSTGYLIASSQGNFSYAVFDRMPPYAYLKSFYIADGEGIDGVEETDGLDILSLPVGDLYPNGLLIVQDGMNRDGKKKRPQNFKLVDWNQLMNTLGLDGLQ